jgi:hypothetical protein
MGDLVEDCEALPDRVILGAYMNDGASIPELHEATQLGQPAGLYAHDAAQSH